jgi:Fe-S-cluster-containing hydrogenase component 2
MAQGEVMMDAATVVDKHCSGCKMCNDMCPYTAINLMMPRKRREFSSCNWNLWRVHRRHQARRFTDEQIYAQIEGYSAVRTIIGFLCLVQLCRTDLPAPRA